MKKAIFGQDLGSRDYNIVGEKLIQVTFQNSHGIEHNWLINQHRQAQSDRYRERERERAHRKRDGRWGNGGVAVATGVEAEVEDEIEPEKWLVFGNSFYLFG